jgi:tryptophan-rich sensory protein
MGKHNITILLFVFFFLSSFVLMKQESSNKMLVQQFHNHSWEPEVFLSLIWAAPWVFAAASNEILWFPYSLQFLLKKHTTHFQLQIEV